MYTDLISYRLAEGVSEEHLRSVADRVHEHWMKHQPGFLSWEIHKLEDGTYADLVHWDSYEHAKASEQHMGDIPNAAEWQACYDMSSVSSKHLYRIAKY